jgi:Bacteriocin-protection, YdeI or OmpD-Associated/Domain of unknown function (DUF1905)
VGAVCNNAVTIQRVESFRAILGGDEGERPTLELPFDAKARFGMARAPVRGTVNGIPFRTTVAVYDGVYLIGFNKELRAKAGIELGDVVAVELQRDDEPRVVEVPPKLSAALGEDDRAQAVFDALSFTHRREYAEWISGAKREETRERRVRKAVTMLRDGQKHP